MDTADDPLAAIRQGRGRIRRACPRGRRCVVPDRGLRARCGFRSRPTPSLPVRPFDPGAHLCDARLGAQHRRRARRATRPRLCRLLRGRRLQLRPDRYDLRPVVLDLLAARGPVRRAVGGDPRLPGVAPARRLSGHRHTGLWRDRAHRVVELDGGDQRAERNLRYSQAQFFRPAPHAHRRRRRGRPSAPFSGSLTVPSMR